MTVCSSEDELVERARHGDREAFSQLVCEHQDRLFRSVFAIIPIYADAEDVVQDAFVRAYTKLHTFKGESCFYTWLYRIARNVALSRRRRKQHFQSLESTMQETTWQPADERASATERTERQEDVVELRKALQRLPTPYSSILILREIEGFDYATIASMLQVKIGTVRSRLHRARLELSAVLRAQEGAASG